MAHSVEEAEILREETVDRLKDELQDVWLLLHGDGSFDLGCNPGAGLLHAEVLE